MKKKFFFKVKMLDLFKKKIGKICFISFLKKMNSELFNQKHFYNISSTSHVRPQQTLVGAGNAVIQCILMDLYFKKLKQRDKFCLIHFKIQAICFHLFFMRFSIYFLSMSKISLKNLS